MECPCFLGGKIFYKYLPNTLYHISSVKLTLSHISLSYGKINQRLDLYVLKISTSFSQEELFLAKLNDGHESSLRRLNDTHREKIALLDRQFLQQKQQLMRAREAAIWEMEERQLHERHQLAKRQLKDLFFLQRHQMLVSF